jgi:hypothetical protein
MGRVGTHSRVKCFRCIRVLSQKRDVIFVDAVVILQRQLRLCGAWTRRDEASRRGGRARTRRDSILSAMYRVWRVEQKSVRDSWQKHRMQINMKQERARRLDDDRTGKRRDELLGARCASAYYWTPRSRPRPQGLTSRQAIR